MSWPGRLAIEHIDQLWIQGQRAGCIHPWERSPILAGDFSPIIRELEPDLKTGQVVVLSTTRPRGALVEDKRTGKEMVYPKPPPEILFTVTIRDVIRHKAGYWRVRFHVFDGRDKSMYVRRNPPATPMGDDEGKEQTEEETRIESGYTMSPAQAVDHLKAVPPEYHTVIEMDKRDREAKRKAAMKAEDEARDLARRLSATIRDTLLTMARNGVDSAEYVAGLAKAVSPEQVEEPQERQAA